MSADLYVPRPTQGPKANAMRERLLAIPEGQALVLRDELERRKAVHALANRADKQKYKVCTRARSDGTFIVWVEKREVTA